MGGEGRDLYMVIWGMYFGEEEEAKVMHAMPISGEGCYAAFFW